jgi:hypothetical protein
VVGESDCHPRPPERRDLQERWAEPNVAQTTRWSGSILSAVTQRSSILKVTGRQRRPVQFVSRAVLRRPVYPTGANRSFADGTHSSWKDVTVNKSVSNWLKTPNVVASVRCGPKIS